MELDESELMISDVSVGVSLFWRANRESCSKPSVLTSIMSSLSLILNLAWTKGKITGLVAGKKLSKVPTPNCIVGFEVIASPFKEGPTRQV